MSAILTGLGLYIIKGIVEAHGGTIKLDSVPQHGTRLSFTLPVITVSTKEDIQLNSIQSQQISNIPTN